ncbi:hypothetical protein Hanom_Chr12g01163691 [Helianthus anomalus]
MWFGQFCHFSPNFKPFASRALWFCFYCHFSPKVKCDQFLQIKPPCFVLLHRGNFVISFYYN